ncbi:MAG: choice-of-anchor R domain-containing protein [Actinomycetota bacterium]
MKLLRFFLSSILAGTLGAFALILAAPPVPAGAVVPNLYSQMDNPSGSADVTEVSSGDALADDFTIPAGTTWAIGQVDVNGGSIAPEATAFNLTFYANSGSTPGATVVSFPGVPAPATGFATYSFVLPHTVYLGPGTYWFSVVAITTGHWGWEGRTVQSGNSGVVFGNPACGSGWQPKSSCSSFYGTSIDNQFAIDGTAIVNPNTCTVTGTLGADTFDPIPGPGVVTCAKDGADQVTVGTGGNVVRAMGGNDTITGGSGADLLYGGRGGDSIVGNGGADRLQGGPGNDTPDGRDGAGGDRIVGGRGTDVCYGDIGDTYHGCESINPAT